MGANYSNKTELTMHFKKKNKDHGFWVHSSQKNCQMYPVKTTLRQQKLSQNHKENFGIKIPLDFK